MFRGNCLVPRCRTFRALDVSCPTWSFHTRRFGRSVPKSWSFRSQWLIILYPGLVVSYSSLFFSISWQILEFVPKVSIIYFEPKCIYSFFIRSWSIRTQIITCSINLAWKRFICLIPKCSLYLIADLFLRPGHFVLWVPKFILWFSKLWIIPMHVFKCQCVNSVLLNCKPASIEDWNTSSVETYPFWTRFLHHKFIIWVSLKQLCHYTKLN